MEILDDIWQWVQSDPYLHHPSQNYTYRECGDVFNPLRGGHSSLWVDPLWFEQDFKEGGVWSLFARNHWEVPLLFCVFYLGLVFVGQKIMNRKSALDLTVTWFLWNLVLSLFSLWGAMRMVEHLSSLIHVYGLRGAICTSPDVTYGACGPSALWTV